MADFITSGTMSCDRLNGGKILGQNIEGCMITSEAVGTSVTIAGGFVSILDSNSRSLLISDHSDVNNYVALGSQKLTAQRSGQNAVQVDTYAAIEYLANHV